AELVVEIEGFLAEAGAAALEHFGAPDRYAGSLLALHDQRDPLPDPGPTLVSATGLAKSFGTNRILPGVDIVARAGEIVAVIGVNGCGKTTLLRILADQEAADDGSVEIAGSIGYAPQTGGLDDHLLPIEHFELFGVTRGLDRAEARAGGLRLADELGWDAEHAPVAGELSGGTRQKLNVVTALLGDPDVVLLDEPCQGFDARSSRRFWDLLDAWVGTERTAIVASHLPDVVHRAATVVELAPGEEP
ncbi:MAG: ABC transporter ATP-binding protein, partial [Actinomycetota bacterium]